MTTKTYIVYTRNLTAIVEKIEKLNKRAAKIKVGGFSLRVIAESTAVAERNNPRKGRWFKDAGRQTEIEITGETPVLGGYTLIARLDHGDDGLNIVNVSPSYDGDLDPKWRTATSYCDHCSTNRRRNSTFLLTCETEGGIKKVGRNCLADFCRTDSPESIADLWFSLTNDIEESDRCGGSQDTGDELALIAAVSASCISKDGWVSKGRARESYDNLRATAEDVAAYLYTNRAKCSPKQREALAAYDPKPEHLDEAQDAIAWAQTLAEESSDYLANLYVLAARGHTTNYRQFGLAVSLIAAYRRHQERLAHRKAEIKAAAASEWQGAVKERLRGIDVLVQRIITNDGYYGPTYIVGMADRDGNRYTTFASRNPSLNGSEVKQGDWVTIDGTVKRHETYKDIKQTTLTRVTFKGRVESGKEAA